MRAAHARGARFVLIIPIHDDLPAEIEAEWLALRPGTDTALMLGIAHTWVSNGWHDRAFLASHLHRLAQFEDYLLGRSDGVPKTAAWAAAISGIAADEIERQARLLPASACWWWCRTRCNAPNTASSRCGWRRCWPPCSASSGCPAAATTTRSAPSPITAAPSTRVPVAAFPQGVNPVKAFIPVARISDMLLNPRAVRLRRPAPDLSGHPAGLLGRRQHRSITIRTSTGCGRRSPTSRRSCA